MVNMNIRLLALWTDVIYAVRLAALLSKLAEIGHAVIGMFPLRSWGKSTLIY
jgi:hypothetical protein